MDEELEMAFLEAQTGKLAASTLIGYRRNLSFVRRRFPGQWPGWLDLTTVKLRDFFIARQREGVSASTTRYQATTLRRFYHYLLERGLVKQNPLTGIQFDNINYNESGLPTYQLLMESIKQNRKRATTMEKTATYLIIETGMRTSELIHLTWGQVDFAMRVVLIKNDEGVGRYVPLTSNLLDLLNKLRETFLTPPDATTPVLALANGKKISRAWVERTVRRVSGGATPAGLRHAYIDKVVSEERFEDANRLAGHKTLVATARYQVNQFHDLKKKYEQYF